MRDSYLNLHSQIMIFSVVIPLLPMTIGVHLLPRYLNTERLLPPLLGRWVFYTYASATLFWVAACVLPGSVQDWLHPVTFAAGVGLSEIAKAVAIILSAVSIFLLALACLGTVYAANRARTVAAPQQPVVYGFVIWAGIQAAVSPFLALALIIRVLEQFFHVGLIDPLMGGDPIVYKHFFWVYLNASLLATLLPAVGVVWSAVWSDDVESRPLSRRARGSFIAFGVTALLSWGAHFSAGESSPFVAGVFGLFALLTLVPLSYQLMSIVREATANRNLRPAVFVASLVFVLVLMIGIATAVILTALPTKLVVQGTGFVTGHAHLLTLGSLLTALVVGYERWYAVRRERRALTGWVKHVCYATIAIGAGVLIVPQLLAGLEGVLSFLRAPSDHGGLLVALISGSLLLIFGITGLLLSQVRTSKLARDLGTD